MTHSHSNPLVQPYSLTVIVMEEALSIRGLAIASTLAFLLFVWNRRSRGPRRNLPLPPGPKKLPLLGNSLDMPSSFQWITFSKWAERFDSDVLHLEVAGADYIVLNSYEAITDLLDKRSGIYSSRPHVTMLQDLIGWDRDLLLLPYGEDLKAHRKLFQQEFHPNNSDLHRPHERKALVIFLNNLLEAPEEWLAHIKHMTGTIILAVAYGIDVQPKNDPNIAAAEKMIAVLNTAGIPGAFLVDVFPILKYVPHWFPGASFQRKARKWNGILAATITPPFMKVKKAMANGTAEDCFSLRCLQNAKTPDPRPDHLSKEEEIIKETVGTMYEGGADTGITALRTFLLAMICFPHAQREAQEEMDRVVGKQRLPAYENLDSKSLPYLRAVIFECLRWQPIVPLAFPHRLDADDTYKGFYIPKGSVIMPNVWAVFRDEKNYGPDVDTFEPKRWLLKDDEGWKINPDMRDPTTIAFGFGRRVCPGKHMGLSSFCINAASLLHSFNITPPTDEFGTPIMPKIEYISAVLNQPAPFQCSIKPRSESHVALIQKALLDLGIES
ncbi:cytochrome P450 [Lentinula aciculospora]|uniref:Cytochrome P450 n=1 Tax=Lentinula aciculospora TaxID=153920 RepID=A0A9W9DTA4_9AGAR|nr:cytochrome P450 [Lentinula aciculospora]